MSPNKPYVLALDLGTTAIKVGLFEVNGRQVKRAVREQKLVFPHPGWVEQSIQFTQTLIGECVRDVMSEYNANHVGAISLSVQRGSMIPLAYEGYPLSDLIVWMDERGLSYIDKTRREISNSMYYKIAGHPLNPITGISKILWLRHELEKVWDMAAVVGNQQTAILKWLGCDEFVMDYSVGSFFFPFDIRKRQWSSVLAEKLNIPLEKLPRLVASVAIVGTLSGNAAKDIGLVPGISLVAGGGDGQCAGVGSGVILPGRMMVNIGTASGIQSYLGQPEFDPNCVINCGAHVVPNAWELEGHTQASGSVLKWFRDEFGFNEKSIEANSLQTAYDLLIDQAMMESAGSDGLLFIPTFYGSTAPMVNSLARGVLIGLTQSHRRSHIIRAILEGISLEIRWMIDTIESVGIPVDEIRLVGGGSHNPNWNQIHADIFNRPIRTIENIDASLVGAAMCAAIAVGEYSNILDATEKFVKPATLYEPSKDNKEIYNDAYVQYRELFTTLSKYNLFRR